MYLPSVAVIGSLLVISAGASTVSGPEPLAGVRTLKVEPKDNSIVAPRSFSSHNKNVIRLNLNNIIKNKTDTPGKVVGLSLDSKFPENNTFINQLNDRPLKLDACTREIGIRATCLEIGKRSHGDRRVLKKSIFKVGKRERQQHVHLSYVIKRLLMHKGFVISYVKVTNKMNLGREGLVSLVKGGTLKKEVVLFMESQKGKKMHFHVEIYANHAAKAYKGQLRSIIKQLKSLV